MKILFISAANGIDYLCDCVFHGFVELFKDDIVDDKYLWYLSDCEQTRNFDCNKLYGKGFTLSKNLYDRTNLDRTNIENKISEHFFDLIIYGSIWRCKDYYKLVCEKYNYNEIILLDGEDQPIINKYFNKGLYFKRELTNDFSTKDTILNNNLKIFPISFSIPKSKFLEINQNKKYKVSPLIPGKRETYIYDNEHNYYQQYNESYFGITRKKAGWDCMRHYEIIASGCLPYFEMFHYCPKLIMVNWPTSLQYDSNRLYTNMLYNSSFDKEEYSKTLKDFYEYALNNFKTTDISKYILSKT